VSEMVYFFWHKSTWQCVLYFV